MSSGECELCTYTVECTHENAVRREVARKDYTCRYEQVNEAEHNWLVKLWNVPVCPDCDTQLWGERAYQIGEQAVREAHEMRGGVCAQCGYREGSPVEHRLELPADLTVIEAEAFSGNVQITHVTIPDGVTAIGARAFAGCTNLVSVSLPAGADVGEGAFDGCPNVQVTTR